MALLVLAVSVESILQYMYALSQKQLLPVAHIGINNALGGNRQQVTDQSLAFIGVLDEDLDCRGQDLELNRALLGGEGLNPAVEGGDGALVDLLGVLTEDPGGCLFGFGLGGVVQQLDEILEHIVVVEF